MATTGPRNIKRKLSKRTLDALHADPAGEYICWDTEVPGFGCRVSPQGKRSYFVQYRNSARRTRKLALGPHGVLTPDLARTMAREALVSVLRGGDPAQDRKDTRQGMTLEEYTAAYLGRHLPTLKPSSRVQAEYHARTLIKALGHRRVDAVAYEDMARLHHALRKTPVKANHTLTFAATMFKAAEQTGHRPRGSNPCAGIKRFRESKRTRYLTQAELSRLGAALAEVEQQGNAHPSCIAAVRLLIFTGARKSEILTLRWDDVDLEAGRLRLKDSKTGAKEVHLNSAAMDVLRGLPRTFGNPHVLPGVRTGQHIQNVESVWSQLREAAGLEGVHLHDLRHTFGSVGAAGNLSLTVVGALLGHSRPATTARYSHLAADPLRAAVEQIGATIQAAMSTPPAPEPAPAEVIPLPKRPTGKARE